MNVMLYLLLLLSLILCCVAAAQNAAPAPKPAVQQANIASVPPLPPTPVDTFRSILAMPQPDRERVLSKLEPQKRQVVMLKLDEYQGLPAEDREERLRALQVRVWVRELIKIPPTNRAERLAHLQPATRQRVEARLAEWDGLPADLQQEVLTNQIAILHIARSPDFKFNPAMPPFPPDENVKKELAHWNRLSEPERLQIVNQFENFIGTLTPAERQKILAGRPAVLKSVAPIANLPKDQRERYLAGLKRFTALTPAERQKFLINVSHWQKMSPEQRESWRVMAKKLSVSNPPAPPPLPGSRPSASILPTVNSASADIPSR